MKTIELAENGELFMEDLGRYNIIEDGEDDIVIIKNFPRREIRKCENLTMNSDIQYKVVELTNDDYYIVKPLDTLKAIAEKFNISVEKLAEINDIKTNKLYIGQKIKL